MPYDAQITRANPTCVLFLLDQSGSMAQKFGRQPDKTKKDGVADVINSCLYNLVIKCSKDDGIYEYLQVGVIGYGSTVGPALGGVLAGKPLLTIGEVANNPLRVEQRWKKSESGGPDRKIRFPVWVEPTANGNTPMTEALELAKQSVGTFLAQWPDCFPPVVINITDGIPTTDPQPMAKALRALESSNGHVLLFNIHISDKPDAPIQFPDSMTNLPDKFAKLLYLMSNVLPPPFVTAARIEQFEVTPQSRGFVFNGDLLSVDKFLTFGTLQATPPPSAPK